MHLMVLEGWCYHHSVRLLNCISVLISLDSYIGVCVPLIMKQLMLIHFSTEQVLFCDNHTFKSAIHWMALMSVSLLSNAVKGAFLYFVQ